MRRYNQRIYRVALAIVRNDSEAEDVMQEAYVRAYQHLGGFAGEAKFSTWLTRIAVYEAISRVRRRARIDGSKSSQRRTKAAWIQYQPKSGIPKRKPMTGN